ncbi:Uncharacterized protein DAT39_006897, partial [Clarias magur]
MCDIVSLLLSKELEEKCIAKQVHILLQGKEGCNQSKEKLKMQGKDKAKEEIIIQGKEVCDQSKEELRIQ